MPPVSRRLRADPPVSLSLGFRVQMAPEGALCLRMDFGDSSGVQVRMRCVSEDVAVTVYHRYRKGTRTLSASGPWQEMLVRVRLWGQQEALDPCTSLPS